MRVSTWSSNVCSSDLAAGGTTPVAAAPAKGAQTPFRCLVSEFAESKLAVGAFVTLVAIILAALLAPWITPQNPYDLAQISILDGRLEPGSESMDGWT